MLCYTAYDPTLALESETDQRCRKSKLITSKFNVMMQPLIKFKGQDLLSSIIVVPIALIAHDMSGTLQYSRNIKITFVFIPVTSCQQDLV